MTGLPGASLAAALSVERTLDRTPWSLGVVSEVGPDSPTQVTAIGAVGRYLGPRWSLSATTRYARTWSGGAQTARTTSGLQLVNGQMMRRRVWISAEADLPIANVGQSQPRMVRAALGWRRHVALRGVGVING